MSWSCCLLFIKQNTLNNVLIVRGNGGRELLADELKNRNVNVQYCESYQRVWHGLPSSQFTIWQNNKINGMVITSNALLKRVVNLIDITNNYWQNTCLWIVASERIAQTALKMGLKQVINTNGASDQAIIKTLQDMGSNND